MTLDGFTVPRPEPGWGDPRLDPRFVIDQVQGGSVVHVGPGAYADTPFEFEFLRRASHIETVLQDHVTYDSNLQMTTDYVFAWPVTVPTRAAISCLRVRLRRGNSPTGYITFEVWDDDAGNPGDKVGVLGNVAAASLSAAVDGADYYLWPEGMAWPLLGNGWVVANGNALVAAAGNYVALKINNPPLPVGGIRSWYTAAWHTTAGAINHTLYQGTEALVLRGLAEAYGSAGPVLRTLVLDDGRRFSCYVHHAEQSWRVKPMQPSEVGVVAVKFGLQLVACLDDQGLP